MQPQILKQDLANEFLTTERCFIIESANASNDTLSIARARVEPGVPTRRHAVEGTVERYIITEGRGQVEVEGLPVEDVGPGDVILIPAGTPQRIINIGDTDLIFYCVCTPPFHPSAYRQLE
jgi:mannose-6-phosphate isomerase-like protein (cupin superfamily)